MLRAIALAFVASGYGGMSYDTPPPLSSGGGQVSGSVSVSGAVTAGTACTGDGTVFDSNGTHGCQRGSDTAPQGVFVRPQAAYPAGTQTAAKLVLCGGQDETKIAIDGADPTVTCAGDNDTVTLTIINSNGTSTATTLTEGTDWTASASVATTCASLATAVSALSGVAASCTSPDVLITLDDDTCSVTVAESTAGCTTVTAGTPGVVQVPGTLQVGLGATVTPELRIGSTYGFYASSSTVGTNAALFQSGGDFKVNAASATYTLDATTNFIKFWGGSAYDLSIFRDAAGVPGIGGGSIATRVGSLSYSCTQATAIDTSLTTLQTIYTVPTSRVLWVDKFVARDASAAITVATVTFGCEGGGAAANIVSSAATLALDAGTEYLVIPASVGAVECAAGAIVSMDTVAQEGAADTITVEMCGWVR